MKPAGRREIDVVLDVDFHERPCRVGTLFHASAHGSGVFSFRYDPGWLQRADAFAIDPELSLHDGEAFPSGQNGTFRVFMDSAPDRWGRMLLDRRESICAQEETRPVRALQEFDYLLGVNDACRMGALRFRRGETGPYLDDDARHAAPPFATLRELEAASLAVEGAAAAESPQYRSWLDLLLVPGSSLGGARPKANFTDSDGTPWIAKFPSRNDRRDAGGWEMLVHTLALKAGIAAPRARLLALGGDSRTYASRRFDRTPAGRRRFFVSATTLLGKRDGEGGSYLELAEFLSTRGSVRHRNSDLRELWKRMAFNILTSNTDDHLRNHGFILEKDGWRLAPAYDMNANPNRGPHALTIDEHDPSGRPELALSTAPFYGLGPEEARELLASVKKAVSGWKEAASALKLSRREVCDMEPAFAA